MKKHDLYMKIVFTLMVLCILVGFSVMFFFKSFVGIFIELLALFILLIAVIWDSQGGLLMNKLTKLQQICPYCHSYADEEKLDVSPNGDCWLSMSMNQD